MDGGPTAPSTRENISSFFKIKHALNATRLFILPVFELDLGLRRAGRGWTGQ